jgi:hypothetical protein
MYLYCLDVCDGLQRWEMMVRSFGPKQFILQADHFFMRRLHVLVKHFFPLTDAYVCIIELWNTPLAKVNYPRKNVLRSGHWSSSTPPKRKIVGSNPAGVYGFRYNLGMHKCTLHSVA